MNTCRPCQFATSSALVVFLLSSLPCYTAAVKLTPANAARQAHMIINKLEQAETITPQLEQEAKAIIQTLTYAGFDKLANQVRGILAKLKEGAPARVPGAPAAPSVSQLQERIDELVARNNSLLDQVEERIKVNAGQAEEIKRLERELVVIKESATGDTKRLADEMDRINQESNQRITALTAERDDATIARQKSETALQRYRTDVEDLERLVMSVTQAQNLIESESMKESMANAKKIENLERETTALTMARDTATITKQEAENELARCRDTVAQLTNILREHNIVVGIEEE